MLSFIFNLWRMLMLLITTHLLFIQVASGERYLFLDLDHTLLYWPEDEIQKRTQETVRWRNGIEQFLWEAYASKKWHVCIYTAARENPNYTKFVDTLVRKVQESAPGREEFEIAKKCRLFRWEWSEKGYGTQKTKDLRNIRLRNDEGKAWTMYDYKGQDPPRIIPTGQAVLVDDKPWNARPLIKVGEVDVPEYVIPIEPWYGEPEERNPFPEVTERLKEFAQRPEDAPLSSEDHYLKNVVMVRMIENERKHNANNPEEASCCLVM